MIATVKETRLVKIDLPEFFEYKLYDSTVFCRLTEDKAIRIDGDNIYTNLPTILIEALSDVEKSKISEISREDFTKQLQRVRDLLLV